jgi:hypothetical protein
LTQVDERETTSLTACVARMLGVSPSEVPGDGGVGLRQWLARRNLGLVPVESPEGFTWPGRFLGRRRGSRTWVVMFGVPPGVVELVAVAAEAEGPMRTVPSAEVLARRGLRGDRYAQGAGTFSDPSGRGYDLTLVEAEALEELSAGGVVLAPAEARRNLVVRGISLDGLIGQRFRVGEVECFGQRRCEPCAHLEKLTRPGVLRGLVHRGGLRADVLSEGEIRVGDVVEALP